MKPVSCKSKRDKDYRFHYCGVCKTIASDYGQKMRVFLNHDITFFAQLLSELSGESRQNWDGSFSRANCFALPSKVEETVPLSFSIASAVNILLAELTLNDKVMDSSGKTASVWKWFKSFVSPRGLEAVERLKGWRFPVEEILSLARLQYKRERIRPRIDNGEKLLGYYSEFTARITGLIFQHASTLTGHAGQKEEMYRIGFGLGSIVYLLDAVEDFEKDRKEKTFNAVSASYGYDNSDSKEPLSVSHRFQAEAILLDHQRDLIKNLSTLPITKEKKEIFSHRLSMNLKSRLKRSTPAKDLAAVCGIDPTKKKPYLFSHSATVRYLRHNRFLQAGLFVLSIPFQYGLLAFGMPNQKPGFQGPDYQEPQGPRQQQQEPLNQDPKNNKRARRERNSCCFCCCDCTECCICADCASGGDGCCCNGCDGCDCCDCCDC